VTDISVCVAVYRRRPAPNATTLIDELPAALGRLDGELRVALNGVSAEVAGVPQDVVAESFHVNRGVAVAWNAAAARATGDVLCFCNDDVALGPRSLDVLHDALISRPEAGIVSPVGALWDMTALRYREWLHADGLPAGDVRACDVVAGYLFALRRDTFKQVGGFDEAYTPCGLEEVDLCTAVRSSLGLGCYAVAGVEHSHDYGISAARPWHRLEFDGRSESLGSIDHRNRLHFAAKWDVDMPRFDRVRHAGELAKLAIRRRLRLGRTS
jgi:GT2 family glycosyltransferase